MSEYTLSYTGAKVNELLSTVSDNHDAWDSISQSADYIIARGTSRDWYYIKFASGLAFMFLYVQPPNSNDYVAQQVYSYPFAVTSVFGQVATINDNGGNALSSLTANVKAIDTTGALLLSLHSVDAYFDSWLPPVTAFVIGRWK